MNDKTFENINIKLEVNLKNLIFWDQICPEGI